MSTGTAPKSYRWVKLSKHCEETGDTPDAVHARRRKRVWTDGVQCRLGPDGNLYINPEAVSYTHLTLPTIYSV